MRWSPTSGISPSRILLIQFKGVGDVVLTTTAMDAILRQWPEAKIHLWTDSIMLPLFQGDSRVAVLWARRRGLDLVRQLFALKRERYDLVLDFQTLTVSAIGSYLSGAYTVGFTRRGRSWAYSLDVLLDEHQGTDYAADHKLDLLRGMGLTPEFQVPRLHLPEPHAIWSGVPGVLLAPVSGVPYKRWLPEAWAETMRIISRASNRPLVLTGGPGEADQVQAVSTLLDAVPHVVHMVESLDEFAQLAAGASLYMGSDNGPRHIAAALGIPTLAWFGPQNPTHWTVPGDSRHGVLWDQGKAGDRHVRKDLWIIEDTPEAAGRAALSLLA